MRTHGTYHTHCERQKSGTSWRFRLTRGSGTKIDYGQLIEKIEPLLQELEYQGRMHVAAYSPGAVRIAAQQIRDLLKELTR